MGMHGSVRLLKKNISRDFEPSRYKCTRFACTDATTVSAMSFVTDSYYDHEPKHVGTRPSRRHDDSSFDPMHMSARRTYSPVGGGNDYGDSGRYEAPLYAHNTKHGHFDKKRTMKMGARGSGDEVPLEAKVEFLKEKLKAMETKPIGVHAENFDSVNEKVDYLRDKLRAIESKVNSPIGAKGGVGASPEFAVQGERIDYLRDRLRDLESKVHAPFGAHPPTEEKVDYLRDRLRALEMKNAPIGAHPSGGGGGADMEEKMDFLRDRLRALEMKSAAPIAAHPSGDVDMEEKVNFLRDKLRMLESKVENVTATIGAHVIDNDGIHVNDKMEFLKEKLKRVESVQSGGSMAVGAKQHVASPPVPHHIESNITQLRNDVDKIKSVLKQSAWKDPFDV